MAAIIETSGTIINMCKNMYYKECSRVVINAFCKNTQKHVGVYVGYGNKEKIIDVVEEYEKSITKTHTLSKPYVEKYECDREYCKCEYVNYYEF